VLSFSSPISRRVLRFTFYRLFFLPCFIISFILFQIDRNSKTTRPITFSLITHSINTMDHHNNPPDEESCIRDGRLRNEPLTDFMDFPPKPPSTLFIKRAVTHEQWSIYVCKREHSCFLMTISIEEATATFGYPSESVFQDYEDLEKNSWQAYEKSN
jgi:hypothetical protein